MDHITSALHCSKFQSEADPTFLSESLYKYPNDDNKTEYSTYQLTTWERLGGKNDGYETIFDSIRFSTNKVQENEILEENRGNDGQCNCSNVLVNLKDILESTADGLSRNTSNIFCDVPIDLGSDDNGEDLKYFDLDGEYLNTYIEGLENNQPNDEKNEDFEVPVVNKPTESKLKENQKKPNAETKTINNKNPTKMDNSRNVNAVQDVIKKDDSVQVKSRKLSTKRSVDKNRNKVQFTVNVHKIQEKRCNLKYLYSYGEDYRGGVNVGHVHCIDTPIVLPFERASTKKKNSKFGKMKLKNNMEHMKKELEEAKLGRAKIEKAKKMKDSKKPKAIEPVEKLEEEEDNNEKNESSVEELVVPKPLLQLNKKNGNYMITMNSINHNRNSVVEKPIVFMLNTVKDTAKSVSSNSSFEVELVPPMTKNMLRPGLKQREVHTTYSEGHLKPIPTASKPQKHK